MKSRFLFILSLGAAFIARGDLLLQDFFDNNNLPTANEPTGGYYAQGSGNGSVVESGTVATLSSSANKNDYYGMLSSNSVSASAITPTTPVRTSWYVSNSDLKAKTSSLIFTWQTSDTLTLTPEFGVLVDLNNQTLNMFANTTNNILDSVLLDADFGDSGDTFELTAIFTETGFEVVGSESLLKGGLPASPPLLAASWGFSISEADEYRAGVFVQANGNDGLVVDVDRITIESIPEPAVVTLIALSGGALLVSRRIFG